MEAIVGSLLWVMDRYNCVSKKIPSLEYMTYAAQL